MEEITIVTFLWGDWCEPYGEQYVEKMQKMVHRNTTVPYKFICFTDRADLYNSSSTSIIYKVIPNNILQWPRILPKFYMYSSDNKLNGRIFYIDLDTVIAGNIDEILSYRGKFGANHSRFIKSKRHLGTISGGFMSFDLPEMNWIFNEVNKNIKKYATLKYADKHGEYGERFVLADLIKKYDIFQDLFPTQFIGYKTDCKKGLPNDARIVCFWYKDKPHQKNEEWIKENWQ